jgi:hypothetical protein
MLPWRGGKAAPCRAQQQEEAWSKANQCIIFFKAAFVLNALEKRWPVRGRCGVDGTTGQASSTDGTAWKSMNNCNRIPKGSFPEAGQKLSPAA